MHNCKLGLCFLLLAGCNESTSNTVQGNTSITSGDSMTIKSSTNTQIHGDNDTTLNLSFAGEWVSIENNDKKQFNVSISKNADTYEGTYCYVLNEGDKMDCGEDISFEFPVTDQASLESDFKSNFSDAKGRVRLSLIKDSLKWEIIQEPQGEFYCPSKTTLVKE